MDNTDPALLLTECPQMNNPDVGQAGRYQQTREPHGVCQMRFMQGESPAFLVREKGFDPKPFRIQGPALAKVNFLAK